MLGLVLQGCKLFGIDLVAEHLVQALAIADLKDGIGGAVTDACVAALWRDFVIPPTVEPVEHLCRGDGASPIGRH